jgi:transcription antitermination factor NusB
VAKKRYHSRTFARLFAMRLLYQSEISEVPLATLLKDADFAIEQDRLEECLYECTVRDTCPQYEFFELFSEKPNEYALTLVQGVTEHLAAIDAEIKEASKHWAVFRMPAVDRAIVRIAVWEMLYNDEVPVSVAINEAVSAAKEFGGEDSSKFINGVLGQIA